MNYKQLTKEIEDISEQIKFLYSIRKIFFKGQREEEITIGNIVNNLCAYQNYLKYSKEYEDKWLAELDKRQYEKKIKELMSAHTEWRD